MKVPQLMFLAAVSALQACADVECPEGQRKIGTMCHRVPASDAANDAGNVVPESDAGIADTRLDSGGSPADRIGTNSQEAPDGSRGSDSTNAPVVGTLPDAEMGSTRGSSAGAPDSGTSTSTDASSAPPAVSTPECGSAKDAGPCAPMNCHTATCTPEGKCEYSVDVGASCGQGVECDANGDCVSSPPVCGNGTLERGEQCDDANEVDTDECVLCKNAFCGDGYVRANEECDPLAPGWTGLCSAGCLRTVYERCSPGSQCPVPNGQVSAACGMHGACTYGPCMAATIGCPKLPGFDVECWMYDFCAIPCSNGNECPNGMQCVEGNVCGSGLSQLPPL